MQIPDRIFFTGVPGSRWSGIAQKLEQDLNLNVSDRNSNREYVHGKFSGHAGSYFGTGMEFPASLESTNLDSPYSDQRPGKLHKSHEWAYMLDDIVIQYPNDAIILIYRSNEDSFKWWKEAGGWNITYPNYDWYVNDQKMLEKIAEQNKLILEFASNNNLKWNSVSGVDGISIAYYNIILNHG